MLLIKATINSTVYYLSQEGIPLTHWWDNKVISFTAPKYQMREQYGGYVELSFGSIQFSQDLFAASWPPPRTITVEVLYTTTTEEAAESFLTGKAYLNNNIIESITYYIYDSAYTQNLLETDISFDSEVSSGTTDGVIASKLIDSTASFLSDTIKAGYKVKNITDGTSTTVVSVDSNTQITLTTDIFTSGEDYSIGDTVPLPRAFGTVTYVEPIRLPDANGNQCYDLGHLQGTFDTDWFLYDDGIRITTNVTNVANNKFEYTVTPVGTLSISGTGEDTTLQTIFDWACGASLLNLSFVHTYDRTVSPNINYWASSQELIIDFLSNIASSNTHLFYIKSSTLYLVDLLLDNGSRTITEWDYFKAPYGYPAPISKITATWQVREAGSWSDPTNTGPAANYVKETEQIHNVESSYTYGEDQTVEPYTDIRDDINTLINNILDIRHRIKSDITIPLQGSLPVPGEKITWTDESFFNDLTIWIRARDITYDFDNEEITISGEGGGS
jgi:hypothetical protein